MANTRRRMLRTQTARPLQTSKTWLEAFVDYAAGECHLAENTVAAYHRDLDHFFAWLDRRNVVDLSIRDLADYVTWLYGRKLAPASIARHIVSLKVFFRYLQLEGVLRDNLAELLGSQKLWERVPKVLSIEQVDRLLSSPGRCDPCWRRDRALLELLYATGCRASEISNLKMRDMHLDECFCVCRGKGDKERMTPLGIRAVEAVRAYLEHERPELAAKSRTPADWVLLSYRGRRLSRERIWELLKRYARRAWSAAGGESAHVAAQLRHASFGRRRRSSASPGDARPRQHRHHATLHARRSHAAEGGPQEVPPAGVRGMLA